jgi:hypothetical protein
MRGDKPFTHEQYKSVLREAYPEANAPTEAPGAKAGGSMAVCPMCKGGPLDGHVAGCAALASDLPPLHLAPGAGNVAQHGEPPSPYEELVEDLVGWQAHARSLNSEHVSIPCSAMDSVIRRLLVPISFGEGKKIYDQGHNDGWNECRQRLLALAALGGVR